MAFRLQAKHLFLTYPHCLEEPQGLLDFLINKLATRNPTYILVAQEEHHNGIPHLHAFCVLSRKLDTNNPRYFDAGEEPHIIHGNYQAAGNPKATYEYVIKGGNIVEHGEVPGYCVDGSKRDVWNDVCLEAFSKATRDECIEVFQTKAPGRFTSSYTNVIARINAEYAAVEPPYEPPHPAGHYNPTPDLLLWYTQALDVSSTLHLSLRSHPDLISHQLRHLFPDLNHSSSTDQLDWQKLFGQDLLEDTATSDPTLPGRIDESTTTSGTTSSTTSHQSS